MRTKITRCVAALLCACTVFGAGVNCYAAAQEEYGDVSGTITPSRITGRFVYSKPGHRLTVILDYQKKLKDGSVIEDDVSATVNGNQTAVSQTSSAGSGNQFIWLSVYGLRDGEMIAVMANLYP